MTRNLFLAAALASAALAAAGGAIAAPGHKASTFFGAWGVDLGDQDEGVRPGDDFFAYQNGKWLARVEFGPNEKAQAYWRELRLLTPQRMAALLDGIAANRGASPASSEGKVGRVYRAYMDQATADAKGLTPLEPEVRAIRAVTTKSQLAAIMGQIAGPGTIRAPTVYGRPTGWSFFRLDNIDQDRDHLDRNVLYVGAGGLALPGPAYYLDPQFEELRRAYVVYIAKTLTLEGWPNPRERAAQILDLETRVAKASWSAEQMLDPVATYNPIAVSQLARFAPGFDWAAFLRGAQLRGVTSVVIDARSAFPKIAAIYRDAPLEVLKSRQAFGLADQHSDLFNSAMLTAAIAFRGDALGDGVYFGGAPRTLRAEKEAEAVLPDVLSALYVAKYSSPAVKAETLAMAENMRRALDLRLQSLSWMTPASRVKARAKLADMHFNIGYPERFERYVGLDIRDQDIYGNHKRSAAYQWRDLVGRLRQPFDRARWHVKPEYANFNYVPTSNTVEIPAALLVSPFFDLRADKAVNYGAVGTTLGAMIASPFFTQRGLEYDPHGRLRPWLAPDELANFGAKTAQIAEQYSAVEALPGLHLKGVLLADEAEGDLAGLEIALDAYRASHAGAPAKLLDGYTGDQRFFLGRAQMWQAKFVDSFVRSQTVTGSNEPPFMRVNGLFPNMDSWYAAFNVKPGDRLYLAPDRRVRLW